MYDTFRVDKAIETECRWVVAKACGKGHPRAAAFSGYRVFLWSDPDVLELDRLVVVYHCESLNVTELFFLK